jgi:hypothetical protein
MRGYPHCNFHTFNLVTSIIRSAFNFLRILSPAEMDIQAGLEPDEHGASPTRDEMRDVYTRDLTTVADCSVMFLLPGWERSRGTFLEVLLAVELSLALFEVSDIGPNSLVLNPITYKEVYERTRFMREPRALPKVRIVRQLSKVLGRLCEVLWSGLRSLREREQRYGIKIHRLNEYRSGLDDGPIICGPASQKALSGVM